MEIATGQVITECHPRHRAAEFLAFLRRVVREFPEGQLHLVLDNSSTHRLSGGESSLQSRDRVAKRLEEELQVTVNAMN